MSVFCWFKLYQVFLSQVIDKCIEMNKWKWESTTSGLFSTILEKKASWLKFLLKKIIKSLFLFLNLF